VQLAPTGGRLIIASDGVWDAMSSRRAARCCRGVQRPEIAARHVVKVGACKLIEILLKLIDGQE
jgi:serine/threonine protein phosphatase PrpC